MIITHRSTASASVRPSSSVIARSASPALSSVRCTIRSRSARALSNFAESCSIRRHRRPAAPTAPSRPSRRARARSPASLNHDPPAQAALRSPSTTPTRMAHTPLAFSALFRPNELFRTVMSAPPWPPDVRHEPVEFRGNGAPLDGLQLTRAIPLSQLAQDPAAGSWRLQDHRDTCIEGERSSGCVPTLVEGGPPASRRAPPPWPPPARRYDDEELSTAPLARALDDHGSRSRPSVHSMTVAARQRRCLPTRKPFGP